MKTTNRLRRNGESGQAAVETLFSIPVFLILFVIGFELFAITWNAQYAHSTARYNAFVEANHRPCRSHDGTTSGMGGGVTGESDPNDVSPDQSPYMQTFAQDRHMVQHAYIVCN